MYIFFIPNPPPDFTTFLFYDTYAFYLITSKVADARPPDLKNGDSSIRSRIRHTSQGDVAAANAVGGIVWWIRVMDSILYIFYEFYVI